MKAIAMTGSRPRRSYLLALGLLAIALPAPGLGALFDDLYTVTVSTDATARDARADAMRRGLAKVLTRVTGRQDAGAYPEMQPLLDSSADYWSLDGRVGSNRWRFEFNATAVNGALRARGMPVWGPERPATLLWLAIEFPSGNRAELASGATGFVNPAGFQSDPAGLESDPADLENGPAGPESAPQGDLPSGSTAVPRERLAIDQTCGDLGGNGRPLYASDPLLPGELEQFEQIVSELLAVCDQRGLPLSVPSLDEIDLRQVQFADVRAAFEDVGFEDYIAVAAERYAPDTVLIGQIDVTETGIDARWTQLRGERAQTLPTQSLRWGIDSLADQYAAEFSVMGDSRVTWITVRDILSWPDYGRVIDHIESVSLVEAVDVEAVNGNDFTLRVVARGDDADLERYLTLDGDLRSQSGAGGPGRPAGLVLVPGWHAAEPEFRPIPTAPFNGGRSSAAGPAGGIPVGAPAAGAPGTARGGVSPISGQSGDLPPDRTP